MYVLLTQRQPPPSTLFPYTTLFRSHPHPDRHRRLDAEREEPDPEPGGRHAGAAIPAAGAPARAGGGHQEGTRRHHHGELRSEEHTSELQSRPHLVCRLLLEKKKPPIVRAPVSWPLVICLRIPHAQHPQDPVTLRLRPSSRPPPRPAHVQLATLRRLHRRSLA